MLAFRRPRFDPQRTGIRRRPHHAGGSRQGAPDRKTMFIPTPSTLKRLVRICTPTGHLADIGRRPPLTLRGRTSLHRFGAGGSGFGPPSAPRTVLQSERHEGVFKNDPSPRHRPAGVGSPRAAADHCGRSAVLHASPRTPPSRAASLSRRPAAFAPRDGRIFAVHFREL